MEQSQNILLVALFIALLAATPVLVKGLFDWLKGWTEYLKERAKAINPDALDMLEYFAEKAVFYAEENGWVAKGEEKLNMAVKFLQRKLDDANMEELELDVLIEEILSTLAQLRAEHPLAFASKRNKL